MKETELSRPQENNIGTLAKIKSFYPSLSVTKKKIASFVLEHPDKVIELSVTALADICSVGEATIIRFCQSLKFKGFQDLKLSIARDLTPSISNIEHDIKDDDDFAIIARKIAYQCGSVFSNTTNVSDMNNIEKAVRLFKISERLFFCGVGFSGLSAMIAKHQFLRLGLNCEYHTDPHFANMIAASLGSNDLLFCFSHLGSTKDMVRCTTIAKEAGAKTIVVTTFPKSPIARVADLILRTTGQYNPVFGGSFSIQLSQLFIVNLLYVGLARELDMKGIEASLKAATAVSDKLY